MREDSIAAILDSLSYDDGIEFKQLLQRSKRGKTTVQRLLPDLMREGLVAVVGQVKRGRAKINLYALDGDRPAMTGPSKFVVRVLEEDMTSTFGPFAILAAQVTP
ncbi:hypothetical protein PQR39_35630 [Paraburkholderia sediminicola]|uniref:hypothetical protein n=1 Tax=Paraburkholderia sediminicola TaxID=458836 RepID=UPI0038BA4B9E